MVYVIIDKYREEVRSDHKSRSNARCQLAPQSFVNGSPQMHADVVYRGAERL